MPCRTLTSRPPLQLLASPTPTFLVQTPQELFLWTRLALQPAQTPPTTLWPLFDAWMQE